MNQASCRVVLLTYTCYLRLVEIIDMKGTVYFIAALPRRDEVFNRLVAIGRQRWESC